MEKYYKIPEYTLRRLIAANARLTAIEQSEKFSTYDIAEVYGDFMGNAIYEYELKPDAYFEDLVDYAIDKNWEKYEVKE